MPIHLYAPDVETLKAVLSKITVYPAPALGPQAATSTHQMVITYDCFLANEATLGTTPNPLVILHAPHNCLAHILNDRSEYKS